MNSGKPAGVVRPRLRERLLIHPLISGLYALIRSVVARLHDPSALRFARNATSLLVRPFRKLRTRAMQAFFENDGWTQAECRALDDVYLAFQGRMFRENARLPVLEDHELRECVSLRGEENLQRALRRKQGVLLVGTHVGNWLLMPALLSVLGYRVSAIAFEIPIDAIENHMQDIWKRYGIRTYHVGRQSVRLARMALARNEALIVAYDASVRPASNIWRPFGPLAIAADPGPSRLARLFNVPIIRMRSRPLDDFRSELTLDPPVTIGEILESNPGKDLMQIWIDELYEEVRARPELWWPWSLVQLGPAEMLQRAEQNTPVSEVHT